MEGKVRRMDQEQKKDKTKRTTGLGRRTREEIGKGNQMTALKFRTGEILNIPNLPSRVQKTKTKTTTAAPAAAAPPPPPPTTTTIKAVLHFLSITYSVHTRCSVHAYRQIRRHYEKVARKRCVLSCVLKDDKDEERRIFNCSEFQTAGDWYSKGMGKSEVFERKNKENWRMSTSSRFGLAVRR